jgi:hypothetical protein
MSEQESLARRATVARGSYDPKTRTFTAIAATSNPVRRRTFNGPVDEVLSLDPGSVRLDRLRSGRAPLLDSHQSGSVSDQIGVVTGARIEGGQLLVDVQLSARADPRMDQIRADLAAGILRNVSVGYAVHASKEIQGNNGTPTIVRADWEPAEVSLVAVPADSKAHIRSMEMQDMDDVIDTETTEPDVAANNARQDDASTETRTMSDRHVREALHLAASIGMDAASAQRHIDAGMSLSEFRTLVLNRRVEEANHTAIRSLNSGGGETLDNPDFLCRSVEDALFARMSGRAPEGAAQELMGRSLLDMGAMLLEARGERVSWRSRERLASQLLTRTASTSDFPVLLTSAGKRLLVANYQAAACPLRDLARQRNASDFRTISMVKLSEAPRLIEVKEGGEVTYGARAEAKEGFALKTYARIFSLTRQAIINDDLGAFADTSAAFGRSAAETEADLLANLLTANNGNGTNLDDGNPLYGTTRGNEAATGTAIDVTNLGLARKAMRDVKGLDGKTPLNIVPAHLVVGTAKETEAEQALAALYAAHVADTNPFSGRLTLHVEPRLSGNAWRLFADPASATTLVYGYLNGSDGPLMETREGWDTLGYEFRCVLDFGCGLEGWRGTYLNPGD